MINNTPPYRYIDQKETFMDRYFSLIMILIFTVSTLLIGLLITFLFNVTAHAEEINITTIIQIESNGNPNARNGQAIGLCQITPPVLQEYNDKWETDIKIDDLYEYGINISICNWYINRRIPYLLRHYHIQDTIKNRIWAYNAGIGNVRRGMMPFETRNYIKKYYRLLKGKT